MRIFAAPPAARDRAMLCVKGIEYLSVSAYLARESRAEDELVERLYQIKFRSWDFLVQRYLRDGMEDEKVKELLKEQFRSRIAHAGSLQLLACADGVGPFGYISPLAVRAEDEERREWYAAEIFSFYDTLTGESTHRTHDPGGNVIICPEIGTLPLLPHSGDFVCPWLLDRKRIKRRRVGDVGRNLVRYALLKGWRAGAEKICAYTLEDTVGFHRSMGAVMLGPFRGEDPAGKRRALMYYEPAVLLEQIGKLARQQTRKDRSASARNDMKGLKAAARALKRLPKPTAPVLAGCPGEEDDDNPPFKRVS
jgi:hypothetical protein